MEDEAVGIEALWKHVIAAQTGWRFLLKWMVVGGIARVVAMGVQFAGTSLAAASGPWPTWMMAIWILAAGSAVSNGALGWLIFGGRWRWPAWAAIPFATPLISLADSGAMAGYGYWSSLLLAFVLEVLLLCGIRKRPIWWLAVSVTSICVSAGLSIGLMTWNPLSSRLPQLGLPTWFNFYFLLGPVAGSLGLAISGSALAWLMPPVVPSGAECNSQ